MTDQPQPVDRAPTRFTKKPITIDAFRLGIDPIPDWFMDAVTRNEAVLHLDRIGDDRGATIKTLEGDHWARATEDPDWVARGVRGEIYPIKPDIFRSSFVLPSEADPVAPAMRAELVRLRERVRTLESAARGGNALNSTADLLEFLADRLCLEHGESKITDYIRCAHERAGMLRAALSQETK